VILRNSIGCCFRRDATIGKDSISYKTTTGRPVHHYGLAIEHSERDTIMTSPLISVLQTWRGTILLVFSIAIGSYFFCVKHRPGLRNIPGPLLAAFSDLDRLITAASGKQYLTHIKYHEKYGNLVRVGPKHVSFSNADLIPIVYGITSKFYKVSQI
jgi:hypothetical protein